MKKSKVLLTLTCAALLVVASVMGTMAYLTDSKTAVNTFTVGNVHINLDEANVDESGNVVGNERTTGSAYHLIPGHSYVKDPTVTVLANSEASYVRMLVTVTFDKELDNDLLNIKLEGNAKTDDDIITGYSSDWQRVGAPTITNTNDGKTVIKYEYRYKNMVSKATTDTKLPALFQGVHVPSSWGNDEMNAYGTFTIDVVAQAIQADGFDDADEAWAAWK